MESFFHGHRGHHTLVFTDQVVPLVMNLPNYLCSVGGERPQIHNYTDLLIICQLRIYVVAWFTDSGWSYCGLVH